MTTATQTTLQTALDFFEAWTTKDLDRAMTFVADDVIFDSPSGRQEGAQAYRDALEGFYEIFKRADLLDAFANDDSAIILYTCETTPVSNAPAVEYVGVEDGKINYKRTIFDSAPYRVAAESR